ncbi:RDD family protein [Bradyrhizobium sp. McL0615]|uniref:RDD family protein n=1 Tax=Bradyrhizobium sp. McL0615 TaxID=3415673 RepID=UPI003CE91722
MAILFGAVMLASVVQNDNFSRALGVLVIAALLLYEPVLVSFTGSTLGHYFTNLRVVDERSGGNVSFLKACARVAIKGALGLYSFVILAATRRNQAVHDLLTKSTVQIRDLTKASPGQYVSERNDPADTNLPSRWRRVAVICGYVVLIFVGHVVVLTGLTEAGLISDACVRNASRCSTGERLFDAAAAVLVLLLVALIIARGWKGKLFGARKAR